MSLEAKLLSSCLNDKQIHVLLQAGVDNLLQTHNDIWQTIRTHYEDYGTLPSPEIVKKAHPDFEYAKDTDGTKYHLDELKSYHVDSGVRAMLRKAASLAQEGKASMALDQLMSDAAMLRHVTSDVKDLDAANADDAIAFFEKQIELRDQGALGVKMGFPEFDMCLPSGIMPGHFGVLLAYPAIGKSWLMAKFAVQAWRNGKVPMIVSLEMTEAEVRNRLYTIIGSGFFSHRKLSAGYININDFKLWHDKTFRGMPPIHILSSDGDFTPNILRGKIEQYKPDIVFLDYLNLMSSNEKADSETVKMKQLSRQLKILAVSEEIPIVAISSATPDDVTDMSSAPTLGQVSWSKQISYDADWLIALGRQPDSDLVTVIFRKNRHGFLGEFVLRVDFDSGIFIDEGVPG